ncbi:MAG TPA: GNAT family N-acetyltransferase [Nocardioidaceae bacterium]|nr:GNAT family N-acetyltransferase [Nocardioidaceae bacterium]
MSTVLTITQESPRRRLAVVVLEPMRAVDVDAVLDVQGPGSIAALSEVFPQDRYPFPRAELRQRWLEEVADPDVACFVIRPDRIVTGFAALHGTELLHFGTEISTWGTGLASLAHDELLATLTDEGATIAWLRVFEVNARARRFYTKHGWTADDERTTSSFPPHPTLLRYEKKL